MILKKYFIPNIISLSSVFAGFISLIMAGYGNIKFAGALIILGALFDALDGRVARALNATNKIGKEIDSLADLVTFGVAPGYLLYNGSLYKLGIFGIIIAGMIPVFATLRLARFNVRPTYKIFEGIPSTFAGLAIAVLQGFYAHFFNLYFFAIFGVIVALLMVSKIQYPKLPAHFSTIHLVIIASLLILSIITAKLTVLFVIFFYIIYGFIFTLMNRDSAEDIDTTKVNI